MEDKEMELLLSEKEMKFGDKRVIIKRISLLDGMRLTQQISSVASLAIGQSSVVSNALMKIAFTGGERLGEDGKPITNSEGKPIQLTEQEVSGIKISGILELFNVLGEDIVDLVKELIVKATNLSDEEAEDIDCVDGVDLIAEIIEVNKPFFQKLSNKLKEKMAKKKDEKPTKKTKSK
jgi:hypothetical protein